MKHITTILAIICCISAKAQVTAQYEYDDLQRLTKATYSNGKGIQYTYDQLGNRIQEIKTSTLSVQEVTPLSNLTVYPNPFQDFLTIQTKEDNLTSVQLIDLNGRVIKQETISGESYQLNLDTLPQAVYILEITSEKGKQSVKVVKK